MSLSSLSTRWFGVFLLSIVGTAGCAQPGTGIPASPMAPSLASGSVSSAATSLAPGASYDGSGLWHLIYVGRNLTDHQVLTLELDATFTQDANGNLHASEDITVVTLTRRGSGRTITYDMSVFESHPSCNTELSGTAEIDTSTNTLKAQLNGINNDGQGCFRAHASISATKR
jgi:hypothetical protein